MIPPSQEIKFFKIFIQTLKEFLSLIFAKDFWGKGFLLKKSIKIKIYEYINIMVNTRVYHGDSQFGREKSERQDDPKLARLQVLKAQAGFQTSGYDDNDLDERKKRLTMHDDENVELSEAENSKVTEEQLGNEAVELEAEERQGNRELLPSQKRKQLVLEKEYKHTTAFGKGSGLEVSNGMYPGGLARLEYMALMMGSSLPKQSVGAKE